MSDKTVNTEKENEFDRLHEYFGEPRRMGFCSPENAGIQLKTYDTWKTRGYIPWKQILRIAKKHNLSPMWIKDGVGDKHISYDHNA